MLSEKLLMFTIGALSSLKDARTMLEIHRVWNHIEMGFLSFGSSIGDVNRGLF
ncbi:Uncharacterised protein [Legionella steigerwaltii]|uniref:Uncharacterized protein n=1 Tax=Legionella steigerwaltii TaxID=460 RepID=A0A378L6K9_9GAMM|nr:hypothetical protein Lstg_2666 [Legionella steigerwaltii]STY22456.1 Uncharacterised protein [Legionella steigerwaltii]